MRPVKSAACVLPAGSCAVRSAAQRRKTGEQVPGGAINASAALILRVLKPARESTLSDLLKLIERAGSGKPQIAQWADKVAAWFVLGLLLFAEDAQGRGHGRRVVAQVERLVAGWPGMVSLRIGVVATNAGGLAFWRKMGFAETGEAVQQPQNIAPTLILEKPL